MELCSPRVLVCIFVCTSIAFSSVSIWLGSHCSARHDFQYDTCQCTYAADGISFSRAERPLFDKRPALHIAGQSAERCTVDITSDDLGVSSNKHKPTWLRSRLISSQFGLIRVLDKFNWALGFRPEVGGGCTSCYRSHCVKLKLKYDIVSSEPTKICILNLSAWISSSTKKNNYDWTFFSV